MKVQFQNARQLLDRSALSESISEHREPDMLMPSRKRMVRGRPSASNVITLVTEIGTGETPEICIREPGGQDASKTNTALLLDQNSKFLAFGSKALEAYYDDNKDGTHLLFEKFKMRLHQNEDGGEPQALALNGRTSSYECLG